MQGGIISLKLIRGKKNQNAARFSQMQARMGEPLTEESSYIYIISSLAKKCILSFVTKCVDWAKKNSISLGKGYDFTSTIKNGSRRTGVNMLSRADKISECVLSLPPDHLILLEALRRLTHLSYTITWCNSQQIVEKAKDEEDILHRGGTIPTFWLKIT